MKPTKIKSRGNTTQLENVAMNPEIWRHIFDAMEDPAFLHDEQFRVLLANLAYCREAGVTKAEALGKPYWEVFPLGTGPLPGCKDAMDRKDHDGNQEEVGVGAKCFLSKSYTARDDQGKALYALHILSDITAQKQADAALAESEKRFRRTTETARDAIFTIDGENSTITAWNPAAEAMFGYSKDEAIGRILHEIITPPRFREAAMKAMAHFSTTGKGAMIDKTLELVAMHKNGTEFHIELSLSAMNTQGKWFATGIARNIHERKQIEAALQKSKDLLQSVVENVPARIFWKDRNLRYLGCNTQFAKDAGLSGPDELTGKTDFDMVWKTQAELYRAGDMAVMESGTPRLNNEEQRTTPDGNTIWLDTSLVPLRDESNQVIGILGIHQDITERKRAEASLKNTAMKFRTVFESSSDAIMLLDEKGFFDCNGATLRMFQCSTRDEFIGKHPAQLSPPNQPGGEDSMRLANERIATAFMNGSNRFEWVHCRLDGAEFPAEVLLTALELDGKPALQATVRDITERKRAAEKDLRLSQMFRTISHGNRVLVYAGDELELVREMCRVLVEEGRFQVAWVGYAETGDAKRILPVAVRGTDQNEIAAMNLTWEDNEQGHEPTGTAVRTGNILVSQDILNDPLWAPWREQAMRRGYAAAATFPLKVNDRVLGALDIYSAEANAFAPDMLDLLAELAGDLAFGIDNLRTRTERMDILEKLKHSLDHAVTAIAATVEMRDPYTAGHQRRVAKLATAIATEMGLPDDQVQGLHMACVLHDIGKIHVPAEILANPGKLSDAELAILKTHPQTGWEILKGIDFPWPVAEIVYQHHEKLDGSGYPRGLKGDEILLEARILTVADVVEAMVSHRPYREGLSIFTALQEITHNKGKLYDVAAVEACLRVFIEKNYKF